MSVVVPRITNQNPDWSSTDGGIDTVARTPGNKLDQKLSPSELRKTYPSVGTSDMEAVAPTEKNLAFFFETFPVAFYTALVTFEAVSIPILGQLGQYLPRSRVK